MNFTNIMFRAKTIGTNCWIYGDLINYKNFKFIGANFKSWKLLCDKEKIRYTEQYMIREKTFGISFGHKDISGRPIFTGDILQDNYNKIYHVLLTSTGILLENKQSKITLSNSAELPELTIIGNIFDYNELLKQQSL